MKELFLEFVTKPSKQGLIMKLFDAAAKNTLTPDKYPNPNQTEALPSFMSLGKSPTNAPPIGRRSIRNQTMSYTIGPVARPNRTGPRDQAKQEMPVIQSVAPSTRASLVLPNLNDLLNQVLEPQNLAVKDASMTTLLNEAQIRDHAAITHESPSIPQLDRICRDVLSINPLFSRCLERRIGHLNSSSRQTRFPSPIQILPLSHEQVPNRFRNHAQRHPTSSPPVRFRTSYRRCPHKTSLQTLKILPCSKAKMYSVNVSVF